MDDRPRATQADRRTRSRHAMLEAAARLLSTGSYGALTLEAVAREAGYTRGALYHQFTGKDELIAAVVDWVLTTWDQQVGVALDLPDPVEALLATAQRHVRFVRRGMARVPQVLRVELPATSGHPVGVRAESRVAATTARCADRISEARAAHSLPHGPPAGDLAEAYMSAVEAIAISVSPVHATELVRRAVRGILGLPPEQEMT